MVKIKIDRQKGNINIVSEIIQQGYGTEGSNKNVQPVCVVKANTKYHIKPIHKSMPNHNISADKLSFQVKNSILGQSAISQDISKTMNRKSYEMYFTHINYRQKIVESLLEKKIKTKYDSIKYKAHKKVSSKALLDNGKSRNIVPKTQKQGGTYELRTRNKNSTQFLYKTHGDTIERRNIPKRSVKNSIGHINKGSLEKRNKKSKNNRLSLIGAISAHSRNLNLIKTSSKDIPLPKHKRKNEFIKNLKKAYICSVLQPNLSMKYN